MEKIILSSTKKNTKITILKNGQLLNSEYFQINFWNLVKAQVFPLFHRKVKTIYWHKNKIENWIL